MLPKTVGSRVQAADSMTRKLYPKSAAQEMLHKMNRWNPPVHQVVLHPPRMLRIVYHSSHPAADKRKAL